MTTKRSRTPAKTTAKESAKKPAKRAASSPAKPAAASARKAAATAKAAAAKPKKTTKAPAKTTRVKDKRDDVNIETLHLPQRWPLVDDIAITESILYNAPWDMPNVPAEGTDPSWLARMGAAAFRNGDDAKANAWWTRIDPSANLAETVKGWRALALVRGIDAIDEKKRREILEEALALAPASSHLAGEILCALGRIYEGLAKIEEARKDAAMVEWRALRHAIWLVRAGKADEAGKLLDKRLGKIARSEEELRIEAMQAWITAGQPKKVRPHLEALRNSLPGLARVLEGRPALDSLPNGLDTLAKDPRLAEIGVWFLDGASREKAHESLEKGPSAPLGVLPGPAMWDALFDGKAYIVVAEALTRSPRTAYLGASRARLLVHPDKPGRIALCLNAKIPAFLWPEANATVEGITSLLAPYRRTLAVDEPRPYDLPHSIRLYIGFGAAVPSPYSGELEELEFHTWSRVATTSPFLENYGWGSEYSEDPHRGFVDRGGLDGMLALRQTGGMDPQRVPSESYRTMYSRSIVTLELHRSGYVIEAKYRPNPHAGAVHAINARFGTSFPEDLPLDCVGVLMHFEGALTADKLMAQIGPELPKEEWWKLHALGALLHETMALDEWLAGLPDVFAHEAHAIAWRYGRLGFLLRRAITTSELREPIQTGPYVTGLAPEHDEDDDDDYDDEGDEEES